MSLPPAPPGLPQPLGGSSTTARAVDRFAATVLGHAEANARATSRALESSRKLQIVLYVLVFAVGLGTAIAAVVTSLMANSIGQAVAGLGLAGLSAASFFAFFLARPLEALERNTIYSQWLLDGGRHSVHADVEAWPGEAVSSSPIS